MLSTILQVPIYALNLLALWLFVPAFVAHGRELITIEGIWPLLLYIGASSLFALFLLARSVIPAWRRRRNARWSVVLLVLAALNIAPYLGLAGFFGTKWAREGGLIG